MMEKDENALVIERKKELAALKHEIATMAPEKALDTILDFHQPPALVHSFKEEDLHFLMHDIGLFDSLPLLALASDKQWDYIIDVETWKKDRVDFVSVVHWLELLLKADPERLARWCYNERLEFIELFLFRNIEVRIRDKNQDGSEFGSEYFTDDETFYVRFLDYPVAHASEKNFKEKRNDVLSRLLKHLALYDHPLYQSLLLEAAGVIPAETEEELFRLRNVRLAEKGFLPPDEAVGVYQPLKPGELQARGKKVYSPKNEPLDLAPVPVYTTTMMDEDNLFARLLMQISDPAVLSRLQTEFASLCNQLISADNLLVKDRQQLRQVTRKAAAYLSMGIETLLAQKKDPEIKDGRYWIEHHFLSDIFRTGYRRVLTLKWNATKFKKQSWFQNTGLALSFWGETGMGIIGGLLIEKPMYYDPPSGKSPYREFKSLEEIDATASIFEEIVAMDDVFSRLNPDIARFNRWKQLSYKNLMLTLWVRHYLDLPMGKDADLAISLDRFRPFFNELWETGTRQHQIGDTFKEVFLSWLADETRVDRHEISMRLGHRFEKLFNEIESELGRVSSTDLDPRFISLFLLK